MPRTHEYAFIALLAIITLLNIHDSYDDYNKCQQGGYSLWNFVPEVLVILLSALGIAFLLRVIRRRMQEVDMLRQQLKTTRKDLSDLNKKMNQFIRDARSDASHEYSEAIQVQLTAWEFTPSEKEIALLLLKGLSFEEIANIRAAKEKTVRQQATAIYRKSSLTGRHEFAAWFFEDFLH
jgi:DNA-binding CsgD family transcriptional regulator